MSIRRSHLVMLAAAFILVMPSHVLFAAQSTSVRRAPRITSETEERILRTRWRALFDSHSWVKLDSLADRLRSQRLRFQGGGWQLHVLYTILSTVDSQSETDTAWNAQIAALQEWVRHSPSSPTPSIALADTYLNFAWKARGNDFADTVAQENWKLFTGRMQKAREALDQAERLSRSDPEWYNAMLVVTSAQDWNRAKADALVDEALRREPGYFYIVRVQADNLLPKWYGNSGDTEQFVAKVADRIGGAEGDATYFFVAEYILTEAEKCLRCSPPTMSWARIRQGYAAIEHLFGTNNFEQNAYAFLAVHAGDAETARRAFERIGDNWNPDVWGSKARFESSRLQVDPAMRKF